MNKTEVMALLKENANERGIAHWKRLAPPGSKVKSFGIGLTQLRKLAKKVGRDHRLAKTLWNSDCYDARVIGLLIEDPKAMTREQAEEQVADLRMGQLAHVFASCDAVLPKTPFAAEMADEWMDSDDDMRRRCGFLLLYELSKDKKNAALTDEYFLRRIAQIRETVEGEENWVKDAMMAALMGVGKRNKVLNKAALAAAKAVKVDIDYGDTGCQVIDVAKHLTAPALKKKLGL